MLAEFDTGSREQWSILNISGQDNLSDGLKQVFPHAAEMGAVLTPVPFTRRLNVFDH